MSQALGSGRAGSVCPFCPQEPTSSDRPGMSEKCHNRTSRRHYSISRHIVNWRTIATNRRSNTSFRSNQSATALSPKYRMTAAFPAEEPCMDRYDFLVLASVASFFALSIAAIWLIVWG
jgi:hypothetical protein